MARNTQDVTAVVKQIDIIEPSIWDFQPAMAALAGARGHAPRFDDRLGPRSMSFARVIVSRQKGKQGWA